MLADAAAQDAAEDQEHGPDSDGSGLVGELARREGRLAKIRAAKQALEDDARDKARAAAEAKARAKGRSEEEAAGAGEEAAAKAQRNFTDPDSRIMKTQDGSFHYAYNGQAVVDGDAQVIVAADVTQAANDVRELPGMLDQAIANTGRKPKRLLADAGYYSDPNVEACAGAGTDGFIATGRLKHGEEVPDAPRGRIPKDATVKQKMARKLRTKPGREAYKRRKAIVEPVFGQMKTVQGAGRLLLRGLEPARAEWRLLAACHNLRKLFNWHVETGLMPV
jgi:hypothetical protein